MTTWHHLGNLDDIPRQGARVVRSDSHGDIAVFRTVNDQVHALADRCPHKHGPLSPGMVHGEKVTCPLHGWTIDLATGEALGADHGCARRFEIKVEEDGIYLGLPSDHD